jgi:hypothetical protein
MVEKTVLEVAIAPKTDNIDFQLTVQELRLIRNFRTLKVGAKEMLVDLSEQYTRTLPADRPDLRLVRPTE